MTSKRTLVPVWAAVVAFGAICLTVYLVAGARPRGVPPWYSVVPPLLAVTLALMTNRILLSLAAAVVVGGMLSAMGGFGGGVPVLFQATGGAFFCGSVLDGQNGWAVDVDNAQILLFVVLIMSMISVMLAGGGLQGVADWLLKFARSAGSTRLLTMATGLVIFIDDYANTMIVGSTFRPMTDRQRISREKLAFLVDATAAPIAGIAVISTWIGVEVGYLSETADKLHVARDGYAMFFDALGYRFYCLGMIAFVFFNALSGEDFGPMAKAERRAATEGKLPDHRTRPAAIRSPAAARPHPGARIHAAVAIVPMAALLAVFAGRLWLDAGGLARPAGDLLRFSVWKEALSDVDSIPLLAHASGIGLLLAMALALTVARIPVWALIRALAAGIRNSWLPVAVLVLAWSLKEACVALQTGDFLAEALGGSLPPMMFPALVFVVGALTSFATGTSWGTMAILIPTAVPVALELDGGVYGLTTIVSIAAVLDGSIFGDHCSPISDTTIMSSTASGCDHLAHVRTQMPYSLTVAAIALLLGYLPAGMGASKWVGMAGGAGAAGLLFFLLWAMRRRRNS